MKILVYEQNGRRLSAKETLAVLWNSWLDECQIEKARQMASDPAVTESQCAEYLNGLENDIQNSIAIWNQYN